MIEQLIEKSRVLIEALPYIQSFKGKKVVVKYGGATMGDGEKGTTILKDIVFMSAVGMHPIIVHGGGGLISYRMNEAGKVPRFIEGLRVTDEETFAIVKDVLVGTINPAIVSEIGKLKGKAVGLSGETGGLIKAVKHPPVTCMEPEGRAIGVDIGYVGAADFIDGERLAGICSDGTIPVIAPIGQGDDGKLYNLNADTVASKVAVAVGAKKLVFLTNVDGIIKDGEILSTINIDEVNHLISENVIAGGMLPKVRAGIDALIGGVRKIHIIHGKIPHTLLLEIFTKKGVGTQITQ